MPAHDTGKPNHPALRDHQHETDFSNLYFDLYRVLFSCYLWKALPPVQPPEVRLSKLEMIVFSEINRERRNHGLPDLIWREDVARVARFHSDNMGKREFFSHDPIEGDLKQRMLRLGVNGWTLCGENIFKEIGNYDPVRKAVVGWMNSPGHRRNILNPEFTHTGIGASFGRDRFLYFTQDFMRPK